MFKIPFSAFLSPILRKPDQICSLLKPIFVYFVWSHRLRRHALPSGLPSSARPYPKERSQQYLRSSLYELLSWKLGGKGPPSDLQPSGRLVRSAHIFGGYPANSYGKGYFYLNFLQSSSSTLRSEIERIECESLVPTKVEQQG